MKKTLLAATMLVAFFAVSCGNANTNSNSGADTTATEPVVMVEETAVVDSTVVDSAAVAVVE